MFIIFMFSKSGRGSSLNGTWEFNIGCCFTSCQVICKMFYDDGKSNW